MIEETIRMLEAKIQEAEKKIALASSSPKKPVTHRTAKEQPQHPRIAEIQNQLTQIYRVGAGHKQRIEGFRKQIADLEEQHGKRDLVQLRNEAKALDAELTALRDKRRTLESLGQDQQAA